MAPDDKFHPEAHEEARELTGERGYGEWGQCIGEASTTSSRCTQPAKGPHGKCRFHGGAEGSGAPEGNQNAVGNDGGADEDNTRAVSHGAYADQSNLYSQEFTETQQALADGIFTDYMDRYEQEHSEEPPTGFELRIFKISVNAVTEMRVENWVTEKPESLHTGTPHIDSSTKIASTGDRYFEYKKSPALAAMNHLSNHNHKWLKSLNLLPDPESSQAEAVGTLVTALTRESNQ